MEDSESEVLPGRRPCRGHSRAAGTAGSAAGTRALWAPRALCTLHSGTLHYTLHRGHSAAGTRDLQSNISSCCSQSPQKTRIRGYSHSADLDCMRGIPRRSHRLTDVAHLQRSWDRASIEHASAIDPAPACRHRLTETGPDSLL